MEPRRGFSLGAEKRHGAMSLLPTPQKQRMTRILTGKRPLKHLDPMKRTAERFGSMAQMHFEPAILAMTIGRYWLRQSGQRLFGRTACCERAIEVPFRLLHTQQATPCAAHPGLIWTSEDAASPIKIIERGLNQGSHVFCCHWIACTHGAGGACFLATVSTFWARAIFWLFLGVACQ